MEELRAESLDILLLSSATAVCCTILWKGLEVRRTSRPELEGEERSNMKKEIVRKSEIDCRNKLEKFDESIKVVSNKGPGPVPASQGRNLVWVVSSYELS